MLTVEPRYPHELILLIFTHVNTKRKNKQQQPYTHTLTTFCNNEFYNTVEFENEVGGGENKKFNECNTQKYQHAIQLNKSFLIK